MRLLRRFPSECNNRIMCSSSNSGYSGVMYITIVFLEISTQKLCGFNLYSGHIIMKNNPARIEIKSSRV